MYKPGAPEPEQDTRHRSKIMQEEHPKLFRFVPKQIIQPLPAVDFLKVEKEDEILNHSRLEKSTKIAKLKQQHIEQLDTLKKEQKEDLKM